MPFVKGQSGNAKGRTKGSVNPVAAEIRSLLRQGVVDTDLVGQILKRVYLIEDDDRFIARALDILDMVVPKMPAEINEEQTERSVTSIFEMIFDKMKQGEIKKAV
ncbi:MAG: hypothetical protein WCR72_01780 [Bacteroidota bacterium]